MKKYTTIEKACLTLSKSINEIRESLFNMDKELERDFEDKKKILSKEDF